MTREISASIRTGHHTGARNGRQRPFRILALDGGGIRGVAPAAFLAHIEQRLKEPICRYFDLIVGTSTGGIIALALSRGVPAKEITQLYRERGGSIFARRMPILPKTLAMMVGPLYKSGPLHAELQRILGEDTLLGEARCRVCIPAVNTSSGHVVVFKTRHHVTFERDYQLPMWRIAAATAAAPTYFQPVHIPDCGWFVDGGLWANSPALVGMAEAVRLGYRPDEVEVLSIGTGRAPFCKEGAHRWRPWTSLRFGLLGWRTGLVDLVMRAQTQRAINFTRYLMPDEHHVRVDFELPVSGAGLDAVHLTERLFHRAVSLAKERSFEIRSRFFEGVTAPFEPIP